jgi:hypothetical protein
MSTLSYQEKSLYGTLAADLLVYVPYFVYVLHHPTTLTHIVGTILLLIVAQIVLNRFLRSPRATGSRMSATGRLRAWGITTPISRWWG